MADWSFLTNHARVLLCIAHDPGARLRDIAADLDITERTAHGIITDLVEAGYVVKEKDGRRNRYQIEANLPLREPASREPAIGEVLAVLLGGRDGAPATGPSRHPSLRVSTKTPTSGRAQLPRLPSANPSAPGRPPVRAHLHQRATRPWPAVNSGRAPACRPPVSGPSV